MIRQPDDIWPLRSDLPERQTSPSGVQRAFPSSTTYLFLHATACGLRRTSTSSPSTDASVLPSVYVKTLGVRNWLCRSCTSTSASATSPAAYRMLCLRLAHLVHGSFPLRHGPKTRYGCAANAYPTGTFTLQDTPSFARRDSA